jgi:hypothetical protein
LKERSCVNNLHLPHTRIPSCNIKVPVLKFCFCLYSIPVLMYNWYVTTDSTKTWHMRTHVAFI